MNNFSDHSILKKNWQLLTLDYTKELGETLQLIHQACQFIAITGKSVFPPRFDDSHTSFFWCFKNKCFASEWMHYEKTFRLEFDPVELIFYIVNYGGDKQVSLKMAGKTRKEVYSQLRQVLTNSGVVVGRFATDMHYDLPQHSVYKGGKYMVVDRKQNLEVVKYYSNAYLVLNLLKGRIPASEEIRCWPHHFDITLEYAIKDRNEENENMLCMGFSPSDGILNKPFFYVSLNNCNLSNNLSKQKLTFGKWLSSDIPTIYLCISSLIGIQDIDIQTETILQFFNEGISNVLQLTAECNHLKELY